ncbi:hypothetical protein KM92DES2_11113 [uncultured Desulfovibrio sp.]|uniref:Uncharacterized protein n=1 Tax=uncultured Desulfovibrio sp. TaxID=167968 RepID=A0A212JHI6_9BACT|nr:hypothetical protein KM92DES2_11113 [uncultured Desulfovibrio sp.]
MNAATPSPPSALKPCPVLACAAPARKNAKAAATSPHRVALAACRWRTLCCKGCGPDTPGDICIAARPHTGERVLIALGF